MLTTGSLDKWGLCLLMMAATTLIYLDRQAVSILAPTIQQELHLNNADLGWVFSSFYYAYTLAQFAVGILLDRFSLRWLYGGAILAWAAASTLTGVATSFVMLLGFRVLLGILESGNWPGAMRIVARTLAPKDRPIGNGIFTSGTSVGALIAPALIYWISAVVGWRASFAVLGVMGGVWFVVWILFTRRQKFAAIWQSQPEEAQPKAGWSTYRTLLGMPQFWRVFCVTILVNPVLYFFLNWLPTYYKQAHGIAPGPRQAKILTATFLGLDLGYLTCGVIVLILVKWGMTLRSSRRAVLLTASCLMAGAGLVPMVGDFNITVGILVMAVFAAGVWIAMYLTLAQEVWPQAVSTAAGLLGGSGSLTGALLMWAVGKVTESTGSFSWPLFGVSCLALLAAVAGWFASRATPAEQEARR